jgi:hypothetical protein
MHTDIDQLIVRIAKGLPFDGEAYPELIDATEEVSVRFAVRHNALHIAKTAGRIAAVSEWWCACYRQPQDVRHRFTREHAPSCRSGRDDRWGVDCGNSKEIC